MTVHSALLAADMLTRRCYALHALMMSAERHADAIRVFAATTPLFDAADAADADIYAALMLPLRLLFYAAPLRRYAGCCYAPCCRALTPPITL